MAQCQPAFYGLRAPDIRDMVLAGGRPLLPERIQPAVSVWRVLYEQTHVPTFESHTCVTLISGTRQLAHANPRCGS
jgi:hypothetical protein